MITENAYQNYMSTYTAKEYSPDAPELLKSISDRTTVRVIVLQDPHLGEPTSQYTQLLNGEHTEISPIDGIDPYSAGGWDLYINLADGWIERADDLERRHWKLTKPFMLLEALIESYPDRVNRLLAERATRSHNLTADQFKGLISSVRKTIGKNILPEYARALNPNLKIIVERRK